MDREQVLVGYGAVVAGVRVALFWVAVAAAAIALLDWGVRTRRINPFGRIGRFCRRVIDPLMLPVERRVLRSGGQPASAPWWTLVAVVVGGILLIALLDFLGGVFSNLLWGASSPGRMGVLLIAWAFGLLRIALIARVVSSWLQISPYSKWVRWAFVLTEWMLAPLRRVIPPLGPVDITPLVAFFLLAIVQRVIGV